MLKLICMVMLFSFSSIVIAGGDIEGRIKALEDKIIELEKIIKKSEETEQADEDKTDSTAVVLEKANTEEKESNNYISDATDILLGGTIRGRLNKDDRDFFNFTVPEDYEGKIRIICRKFNNAAITVEVYNDVEKKVANESGIDGDPVSLSFIPESGSRYYVVIKWLVFPGQLNYELVVRKEN